MSAILDNPIVKEDIKKIAETDYIDWENFRGKKIAVTGATGLLGRIVVSALLAANQKYDLNLKVLAFIRNEAKAEEVYGTKRGGALEFVIADILNPIPEKIHADYLIHGASVTASRMMVEQPVETILTAVEGTKNLMEFAARCKMEGVVYLSSMEAYGIIDADTKQVHEEDLGYIDILNVRSSYSEGKRMTECLCASYAKEYQVNVKIARLAQTFGAGIDKNENRVFAQFAKSVLGKENIVLHTKGEKANCYCYTVDAVTGLLVLLTRGNAGEAYNVANMDTFCSIREMAETFVAVGDSGSSELVFDIPEDISKFGYPPSSIMHLNSEKLMALGWKPQYNMRDMAARLMQSME